ncbi:hypothetical protein, partial [Succinimonas sp.]|uniref:hypothetical protein n=1 Tax=Succinimonas sp. TaxID=1936151 RepID=UPI003868B677
MTAVSIIGRETSSSDWAFKLHPEIHSSAAAMPNLVMNIECERIKASKKYIPKTENGISDDTPFCISGGTDGARTRDLLRDRQ